MDNEPIKRGNEDSVRHAVVIRFKGLCRYVNEVMAETIIYLGTKSDKGS